MERKKLFINKTLILVLLALLILSPSLARADMGPKPTVRIQTTGLDDNTNYYISLISKESSGPWLGNEFEKDDSPQGRLARFQDKDGYKFHGNAGEMEGNDVYVWGYYPPTDFKILIYFPDQEAYALSQPMETYAFHSQYRLDLEEVQGQVRAGEDLVEISPNDIRKSPYVLSLAFGLILGVVGTVFTLVIELAFAYLVGYRDDESLKKITGVNIITRSLLVIITNLANYKAGFFAYLALLLPLEIIILVAEAIIYSRILDKKEGRLGPVAYGVLANILSFFLGILLFVFLIFLT